MKNRSNPADRKGNDKRSIDAPQDDRFFKVILSSIAVVDVKVHDKHPLHPALGQGVARRNSHVVKEAESHPSAAQCVVARGSH